MKNKVEKKTMKNNPKKNILKIKKKFAERSKNSKM
mgnify:CR=1 FL=1